MEIVLDASEIYAFAQAMEMSPDALDSELTVAANVTLHEGIGYAQEHAPRGDGVLAGSIVILEGPTAEGGSYGSTLVYAWQREEGGTIYPRNKRYLAFRLPEAVTPDNPEGWVFATKVTQTGSKYMQKSLEDLEPRVLKIYELAVDRFLGVI